MMTRSNGSHSVTSTDLLIAMLSSDLRSSWGGERGGSAIRIREHADPAASSQLPVTSEPEDPEDPAR
jgi:hypothetical protein